MKWPSVLAVGALSACSCSRPSTPPPAGRPAAVLVPPRAESAAPQASAPGPAASAPEPASSPGPTLATAGAERCTILEPVALGPRASGETAVGFGPGGGVAAWKRDENTLAVQPIALDAQKIGPPSSLPVGESIEPWQIYPILQGFVVLLRRWDWRARDVSWSAFVVDRRGRAAHPPIDVGLADMNVLVGQPLDGHRIGLIVGGAVIARQERPGRWQTLTVGPDGALQSTATAVAVDDLVTTTDDRWEPAELSGRRGWAVQSAGVRKPEGVFAGVRAPAALAVSLVAAGALVGEVRNGAVPPPRGPRGTIYEAMGLPTLVRTQGDREVGQRLALAWRGDRVGATGMYVQSALGWSGSHFIYPFHDDRGGSRGAGLLPIDCRP